MSNNLWCLISMWQKTANLSLMLISCVTGSLQCITQELLVQYIDDTVFSFGSKVSSPVLDQWIFCPCSSFMHNGQNLLSYMPKYIPSNDKFPRSKFFSNVGVLPHAKKVFPFTMQGKQAYAKFKVPIETGLQTILNHMISSIYWWTVKKCNTPVYGRKKDSGTFFPPVMRPGRKYM